MTGGLVDAENTVAPFGYIDIEFKNPSLGKLFFNSPGENGFLDFAYRIF